MKSIEAQIVFWAAYPDQIGVMKSSLPLSAFTSPAVSRGLGSLFALSGFLLAPFPSATAQTTRWTGPTNFLPIGGAIPIGLSVVM